MNKNKLEIGLLSRIKKFINNIELSQEQKTKIQKSHQYLRKNYLNKLDYVSNTFLTGSYKKSTLINHSNNDVDMFVVLNGYNQYNIKPDTVLDKLKKDLKSKYTTTEIKQNKPCIVLNFRHITFELTPVIKIDNTLQLALGLENIPEFYMPNLSSNNEWVKIDNPRILEKELSIANKKFDNQLVPLIKMMKKCKLHNNISNIQSFEIEKLAIDNLNYINNYRNGIEQLLKIYGWTHPNYTYEEIENFTDICFAKFCRDSLFGNDFPMVKG